MDRTWQIAAATLLCLTAGCKQRSSASAVLSVDQNAVAWYVGAETPLSICVKASAAVTSHLAKGGKPQKVLEYTVWRTYFNWLYYLYNKGLQPVFLPPDGAHTYTVDSASKTDWDWGHEGEIYGWGGKFNAVGSTSTTFPNSPERASKQELAVAFPIGMTFTDDCDAADLEVHFGTSPNFALKTDAAEPASVLGRSVLSGGTSTTSRRHGAIILPEHGEELNYDDIAEADVMLMHEWGHVLGVPHVVGTIMDPEELGRFMKNAKLTRGVVPPYDRMSQFFFTSQIDHWRELAFCQKKSNCENFGQAYEGTSALGQLHADTGLEFLTIPNQTTTSLLEVDKKDSQVIHLASDANADQLEVEQATDLVEVFRKPDSLHAPKIYNQARVVNRWINGQFLLKTLMNVNDRDSSAIAAVADCQGQSFSLFQSLHFSNWGDSNSRTYFPAGTIPSDVGRKLLADCLGTVDDATKLSKTELTEAQKQDLGKRAKVVHDRFQTQTLTLRGDPDHGVVLPKADTMCGAFVQGLNICLWRSGDVAAIQVQEASGATETCYPTKHQMNAKYDAPEDIAESRYCTMTFNPRTEFVRHTLRVNLGKESRGQESTPYSVDVYLDNGVWGRIFSGTLAAPLVGG